MPRDLSLKERDLLNKKIPKALNQGRKSEDTKIKANKVLVDAGYDEYFSIDDVKESNKKRKIGNIDKAPSIYLPMKAASSSGRLKVKTLFCIKFYFIKIN